MNNVHVVHRGDVVLYGRSESFELVMTAKDAKASDIVRYDSLDTLPSAPPLSMAFKAMSDGEIEARALADVDAGVVSADFSDKAQILESEGAQ